MIGSLRSRVVRRVVPLIVEPLIGARYLTLASHLRDFYAWAPEAREAWQRHRLEVVLDQARREVPFYRSVLRSTDLRDVTLEELPVVDKARLRAEPDGFRNERWEQMPHVQKRTGGTTGDPWQYPLDKSAWAQMYAAVIHFFERTGYRYGERIVLMGSPPSLHPESQTLASTLRGWLENRVVSTAGVDVGPAMSMKRALDAEHAHGTLWYGFASAIYAVASAVTDAGISVRGPRAIVTTAEPLSAAWRHRIETTFRVPVFDQYGANDGGVLAQTCEQGGFHVAENVSIVEILGDDGGPASAGVEGDVVVTNLHARAQPFIRYRVGDRAAWLEGPCRCGRRGPTLAAVSGREGDLLILPDGRRISAPALTHAFWDALKVRRWQLVQHSPDHLTARLDADPDFGDADWQIILDALRRQCGDQVQIDHTTRDPLEVSANGKHKIVVRRF